MVGKLVEPHHPAIRSRIGRKQRRIRIAALEIVTDGGTVAQAHDVVAKRRYLTKRARQFEGRRSVMWRDRPVFGVETFFGNEGQNLTHGGGQG
jgi:hypothetical protein